MIARRWLIALAVAAGAVAAGAYYAATLRVDVVVVTRDIEVPRPLTADDVALRPLSAEAVPADAARAIDEVVGLVPRGPMWRGQLVMTRGVAAEVADFRSGLPLAPGQRAIAIPVSAVDAIGGAVIPGSRVDVVAVPVLGRAPAGRTTELLATSALVLDVRGESGAPLVAPQAVSDAVVADRLASVVIAIDAAEALRFADRIATSTFVLALAGAR